MPKAAALHLADIETFLVVHRLGSISAAARELLVTPSQVSKAVSRLEAHFGASLLVRGAHGVRLSETGRRLAPKLEESLAGLRNVSRIVKPEPLVTIAAPSYVNTFLVPEMAASVPGLRLRSLELPPSLVRALCPSNLFDATALLGPPRLPTNWKATSIGPCRITLFASPRLAAELGPQPVRVERLKEIPFISPIYNVGGQYMPVDDDCPIPQSSRRSGNEAQTIGVALDLAAATDQLVYGPAFAASAHLARGAVVEVRVQGWDHRVDLHFACNSDTMLAKVENAFVEAIRRVHQRLEKPDVAGAAGT